MSREHREQDAADERAGLPPPGMFPLQPDAPVQIACGTCSATDPAYSLCLHHARCATFGLHIAGLRLDETLAQMRKDGQGITSDQRLTLRRGLGIE